MLARTLAILLATAVLAGQARAQQSPTVSPPVKPTMPYKPSAQPTQKQQTPKSCIQFMLNSKAHKECIEAQAKAVDAAKKSKPKS